MFPMHQVLMMIKFYPCCGLFQIRKMGGLLSELCGYHTALQMTITQVLRPAFCDICDKNFYFSSRILFYTKNVFIYVCLCFVCLICHFTYITLFLFTYAHYWISWGSRNSNFFNLEFEIVLLFHKPLSCNFYNCHWPVISINILNKCLSIVEGDNFNQWFFNKPNCQKHYYSFLFVYTQTETTFVCMSDCCVVKVGVVFSVVDKFQCRLGIPIWI